MQCMYMMKMNTVWFIINKISEHILVAVKLLSIKERRPKTSVSK